MNRIWKHRRTSLVATIVILVSLGLVWMEKATLTEVGLFLATGIAGLFAKDPKPKNRNSDHYVENDSSNTNRSRGRFRRG